jgi:hypothetical protein
VTESELIRYFPVLYHITEARAWPSIRRNGLECTSAILDRFGLHGPERAAIESNRRETAVELHHSLHSQVRLSDQRPINMKLLSRCLKNTSTSEWFELLNKRVFFWPTRDRLDRHLKARLSHERDQCVLTFDTAALVERYRATMHFSALNSGCTRPPQPRGADTFKALADYPFDDLRHRRGPSKSIAEVTVLWRVDGIEDVVTRVETFRLPPAPG